MNPPAVTATDLVKVFGTTRAVDGLTVSVPAGEVTAILGPNGAGKSTTLRLAQGLLRPDEGEIRVLGLDPLTGAADLRARVGVQLQAGGLPAAIRASEAIRFVARLYAHPVPPEDLIEVFALDSFGRTSFRRLSGGEQRRVAIAAALVGRPELVFLDEPTSGMDPQGRHLVWDVVRGLRDSGVTVVLSTHLMDEAAELADQVVIVDHGRVVVTGSPADLTAGGTDRVTFHAPAHLPIDALKAALPSGLGVTESPAGTYVVVGTVNPQVLSTVTSWCAANGAMPSDLVVGRRSLEDVFLELTGRELRA